MRGRAGARGGASARRETRGAGQVLRQAPKGEVAYAVPPPSYTPRPSPRTNRTRRVLQVGGVVVVHQLTDNTQQFFAGHQGREITALTIHPEENIIATGEQPVSLSSPSPLRPALP